MTRGVKTKLTDAQWRKMGELAKANCQTKTIATAMGYNESTFRENKEIREFLHKKRCEGLIDLRKIQKRQAKSFPAMAIWLGKNQLGQTDRTDHNLNVHFEPIKVDLG